MVTIDDCASRCESVVMETAVIAGCVSLCEAVVAGGGLEGSRWYYVVGAAVVTVMQVLCQVRLQLILISTTQKPP